MHFIPLFKGSVMRTAILFYRKVLDFWMARPEDTPDLPEVDLGQEEMLFQITTSESERLFGSVGLRLCSGCGRGIWQIQESRTRHFDKAKAQ